MPRRHLRVPFFSDDRAVGTGRWSVIGFSSEAPSVFGPPDFYYHPNGILSAGEGFGMAERSGEPPRNLSREELETVFAEIPANTRHNFLTEEEMERFLDELPLRYN